MSGFVMSCACYIWSLLCPAFVMSSVRLSRVCLSRIGYGINNFCKSIRAIEGSGVGLL